MVFAHRRFADGALVAIAIAVTACTPAIAPEPTAAAPVMHSARIVPAPDAKIDVALAGPSRVLYSPATMRVPRPAVRVIVTNPGAEPLDVADLRVGLDVTRGSQRVHCEDARADESRRREPLTLAPGTSATYVRLVDCPLAIVGTYVVRVVVSFGRVEPFAHGVVARELAMTVAAPPDAQPRAIAAVPGLHAAIGSAGMVSSTSGLGRMVVALVNERSEGIALPPMSIALRVRRAGTDIPCEDEPTPLALPAMLDANAVVTRPIDVSCLGLGVTGTYDVEARLLVGEHAFPIGSLRLDVTSDPSHVNRRLLP